MTSDNKPHGLYILTLAIELFISGSARFTLYWLVAIIPTAAIVGVFFFTGDAALSMPLINAVLGLLLFGIFIGGIVVGYAPIIFSLAAYLGYGSGHTLTRYALGAREPSTRENEQIYEMRKAILEGAGHKEMKGFSGIFIIDSPIEYLYLIGTTLYISSGSLRSQHFQVLLAHETGHADNEDGAMILALRRLVFPLSYIFIANVRDFSTARPNSREIVAERPNVPTNIPDLSGLDSQPATVFFSIVNSVLFFILSFAGGGLGVWITSGLWAKYFRERDYLADKTVVELSMKDELIDYLEQKRFYDTSVPFMQNWQPANEQRIDWLLLD